MSNKGFDFSNMRNSINRVIEDTLSFTSGPLNLPVDIIDAGENVVVLTVPLLGIVPEKLDISVSGEYLTINGETAPVDDEIPEDAYLRRERRYGAFQRKVHVPVPVKPNAARAELKNGILKITLPKIAEPEPTVINVVSADEEPTPPSAPDTALDDEAGTTS